jgi:predicted component of type VI protein secretion system
MPWLTTEGSSHQIPEGETVVGSGTNTGWQLQSHDLAARHFIIERAGTRVTIRPCGVDAVVAVNGAQCGAQPMALKDGDTIEAGSVRFLYSDERSGSYAAIAVQPAHLVEVRHGISYDLDSASIGIGRDRVNAIVVRDPTASRFHAEIRREAGGYVLHPHGSSGTALNGRRLGAPERLSDGDRVEIANVEFRFVAGAMPAGAKTAEPAADDEPTRESSHRPTVIQTAVMEIPSEPEQRARSTKWIWIAAVLVAGATIYLATR